MPHPELYRYRYRYKLNQKESGNANKTLALPIRLYSKSQKGWDYKQEEQCATMTFVKASGWEPLNAGVKKG